MKTSQKMNLRGMHNINNIMFLIAIANILKLDIPKMLKTIEEFKPLEHRMEFVGKVDDVYYYNDSIATIPESTINSIEAIENINTLIVGGKDRGINLDEFCIYLNESEISNIICIHKTGEYIYNKLDKRNKKVYRTDDLKEAVKIAKEVTSKGKVCLLSPAASSYGYFKNFEERGTLYKEYVKTKQR